MGRTKQKIGPLTLKRIRRLTAGRHHDKDGLYLELSETGNGSWLLRYQRDRKEHWHGLGPLRDFTLDEARERARRARQQLRDGQDPIEQKREGRAKQKLEAAKAITFEKAARQYFETHQMKWSPKHRGQFISTLEQHAFPKLASLSVASIDTPLVLSVLEPFWIERYVTMSRVRAQIEKVLDWCVPRGYRPPGLNPAAWNGNLKATLPSKPVKVINHPALPYDDVPAFVEALSKRQGTGPRALEFLILTAARTGEVLGARWSEIDLEKKVWTIPGSRMKGRRVHKVPLTARMIQLLKSLPREGGGLVFIGSRANAPLSKMVMPDLIKAVGYETTIHGMRASFRTWAAESTAFARELIEVALAHAVGDATEQAYQRGDLLEKRRALMEAWSSFVATPSRAKTGNNVTPMRKGGV